jgi:hypothetical protein
MIQKMCMGAKFGDDKKYRYSLFRIWDKSKPLIMFIGLNPSTANENENDPTISRVISMANSWGYGGVYMMNLFPIFSTYPEKWELVNIKENDGELLEIANKCDTIVFAWGGSCKNLSGRDKTMISMFPNAMALRINKDGSPHHPLYINTDVELINYKENAKI